MAEENIYIIGKFSYVIGNANLEILSFNNGSYQAYEVQDGFTFDFKDKAALLETVACWSSRKLEHAMKSMTEGI